jgi:hypothetical protein
MRIKVVCLTAFVIGALFVFGNDDRIVERTSAFSEGPPAGFTGAPGEQTCTSCHSGTATGGEFAIVPPRKYFPGRTYQVAVQHTNPDITRDRWGFQLTALADTTMAGSFATTDLFTQIVGGVQRDYIEHTGAGTFSGTTGGVSWSFNWTAPATELGPVTFYAAGNQADGANGPQGDLILTATALSRPSDPIFDFDGDNKTDLGVFRPSSGQWWINRSSDAQTIAAQFGAPDDKIAPADFTGDGKTDIAIWRPSTGFWFVLRSEDFSFFGFPFGSAGDIPVPADYDGDAIADPTLFRPSENKWYILQTTGGTAVVPFGAAGDQPVPSDYDGDGRADLAIRRPLGASGGAEWWINRTTAGGLVVPFGTSTDLALPGDFTGDGKSDIAFWRPSNGSWFVVRSENFSYYSVPFGSPGDIPAPGDYDGDGKWDTAIFRPSDTKWYVDRSTAGILIQQFGAAGDRPVPNAFVP